MKEKYYAVKTGKVPGIYRTWESCRSMVHGFPGAVYKSFSTWEEAQAFLEDKANEPAVSPGRKESKEQKGASAAPENYAFVDGSFHAAKGIYGYGGFLIHGGEKEILQGSGTDAEMASMRNVAGEILGSMAAVKRAVELGLPELTIYYDYMGIEMWADGTWKRNKKGTAAYHDYIASVKDRIKLHFVKVKGHSGIDGNEEADRLAKEAVGNL